MWILTSDGPWLGGRRVWLRPGERHLFGRTTGRSAEGQKNHHIDERSVSRQHLVVEVSPVRPGDSAHLHARSEVKLIDNSKVGTALNGDSFTKSTRIVGQAGTDFTIKLGKNGPEFRLRWQTVALTFSTLPKGTKQKQETLKPYRDGLEPNDIKILTEYVTKHTTHVIAKKRNIPAVLQALTQAKSIVTEEYALALIEATRKRGTDVNGDVMPSLLEDDLDANWPDANEYIPQAGEEPVPRPKDFLKPDVARAEVFQKFVFMFQSQKQLDNLIGAITGGGGKAFCQEFEAGVTKVEDLAGYARSLAGYRRDDLFKLSQQQGPGGIVFVRRQDASEEYQDFNKRAQLEFGQRSIEQSELLDTILTLDTSALRRELEEEGPENDGQVDASAQSSTTSKTPLRARRPSIAPQRPPIASNEPEQPDEPPRRRQRRPITQSRFKGFDDFDPTQFTKPEPESLEFHERTGRFVHGASLASDEQGMEIGESTSAQEGTNPNPRKRKTADEEYQEMEDAHLEGLLAGANRLKRQRTEALEDSLNNSERTSLASETLQPKEAGTTRSKRRNSGDDRIAAEMKKRREQEDEGRRQEEEKLRQAMEGVDISSLQDLAKVETMEVPTRAPNHHRQAHTEVSLDRDRWDPAWNGRKNFKKFQRQGERRDRPRLQRVIVTLEEVPRRAHGIEDEYWSSRSSNPSTRKSQSLSQSVRGNRSQRDQLQHVSRTDADEDNGDVASFRRRIQISREEDAYENGGAGLIDDDVRGTGRTGSTQASSGQSIRPSGQSIPSTSKRPAQDQGGTVSKRTKQSQLPSFKEAVPVDDDDDDDGLKFRRRKR
ncbi:hypothetical protein K431DRAFT_219237 [Polychaeton citri CBS 116435]|uniref:FHA domain-containing protein n=1 Tax=Polychaeton citri CBS 116435 TaxID=1314669 RepID=A0A9P4USP2_9PEZI|nr:hypothetical protein K431DRAFT_219237 [Polychaeton citri CBS 116435]